MEQRVDGQVAGQVPHQGDVQRQCPFPSPFASGGGDEPRSPEAATRAAQGGALCVRAAVAPQVLDGHRHAQPLWCRRLSTVKMAAGVALLIFQVCGQQPQLRPATHVEARQRMRSAHPRGPAASSARPARMAVHGMRGAAAGQSMLGQCAAPCGRRARAPNAWVSCACAL